MNGWALLHKETKPIGYRSVDYDYVIATSQVNDVAMTVLPNAPIDSATGLPVPTIAVATNSGVSVIKDDGSVFDLTYQEASNRIVKMIDIDSNGRIYWSTRETGSAPGVYFHEADVPAADSSAEPPVNISCHQAGATNAVKPTLIDGALREVIRTKDRTVLGMSGTDNKAHLNLYNVTGDVNSSGSVDNFEVVDISTDYNTGYIIGDIKGAFLSDTDTTNVTGSELVTNGTFDSNINGWTDHSDSGGSISWNSSGYLNVVYSSANARATQDITVVVGKQYVITFDVIAETGSASGNFYAGSTTQGTDYVQQALNAGSSYTFTVKATTTTLSISFRAFTGAGTVTIDNVSVRIAEADRSVNDNGAQSIRNNHQECRCDWCRTGFL